MSINPTRLPPPSRAAALSAVGPVARGCAWVGMVAVVLDSAARSRHFRGGCLVIGARGPLDWPTIDPHRSSRGLCWPLGLHSPPSPSVSLPVAVVLRWFHRPSFHPTKQKRREYWRFPFTTTEAVERARYCVKQKRVLLFSSALCAFCYVTAVVVVCFLLRLTALCCATFTL